MKVVERIVKVLEGIVHLTIIVAVFPAVWTLYNLAEKNLAGMTIKIVNDFGYPIEVRCPEAINYPVWRTMGVSLNRH